MESYTLPKWITRSRTSIITYIPSEAALDECKYLPWRFHYVEYAMVQQDMSHSHSSDDNVVFSHRLEAEWNKVHDFYMMKRGELDRRISSCQKWMMDSKQHKTLSSMLRSILDDIYHLHQFTRINYFKCLRLFVYFDRLFGPPVDSLRRAIVNKPFWNHTDLFCQMAAQVNTLYRASWEQSDNLVSYKHLTDYLEALQVPYHYHDDDQMETTSLRQDIASHPHVHQHPHQSNVNNNALKNNNNNTRRPVLSLDTKEESTMNNNSKSYWIHPDHILEIKLFLSSRLELTSPSDACTATHEIGKSSLISQESSSLCEQQCKVKTLYFDTPQLEGYAALLTDGTQGDTTLSRARWYDALPSYTALEQKHYVNSPEQEDCWIEQRLWLKSKRLPPWMQGAFSLGDVLSKRTCQYITEGCPSSQHDIQRSRKLCAVMEEEVHSQQKVPVLQATQSRIMYTSRDRSVSVTIDSDITLIRADNDLNMQEWPLNDSYTTTVNSSTTSAAFPYGVVQITCNTAKQNGNVWLAELAKCSLLYPVRGFSTYLHGVATLLEPELLPAWLSSMSDFDSQHQGTSGSLLQPQKAKDTRKRPLATKISIDSIQSSRSISSRSSSSNNTHYCSTTTIATIVTCYDDDSKQQQEQEQEPPISPISPLLHPHDYSQQRIRRSFDSYCSFDHPTSSRSDPANCKNCMGRALFLTHSHRSDKDSLLPLTNALFTDDYEDTVTFSSFLLQLFCSRRLRSFEKEPLLGQQQRNYRTVAENPYFKPADESLSRAIVLTATCVVMSFGISLFLYITTMI